MARSVSVRPGETQHRTIRSARSIVEMHHHADSNAAVEDRLAPHGDAATIRQDDVDDGRRGARHDLFGVMTQQRLVLRLHEPLGGSVRDHDSAVGDKHRMLPAAALAQEPLHHHAVREAGVVEQPLLDLVGGTARQGEHQCARIAVPST